MAQVGTGTGGVMDLTIIEVSSNAVANTSQVRVIAQIYSPSGTWGSPMGGWSLSGLASGSWSTTTAAGWETIYDNTFTVAHNADGTGSFGTTFHIDATGTSGVAGPTDLGASLTLTTLKVIPAAPIACSAVYVSDTQVTVNWTPGSSASNGAPVNNTIQKRINGGAWADAATIGATNTVNLTVAANQQLEFRVLASNTAGSSGYSPISASIYTTPGDPSNVVATKSGSDIVITFDENVAYAAYNHEVWHGTISGGVTTWDGAALTTLAGYVLTYTHVAPNPAQVHVYRVRAKSGSLLSGYATSNSVQLLTAPAKPTIPALAAFADKASIYRLPWVHNPIDSSAQTKYQWRWSTNGGSSWTTGSKTTSVNQYKDFAANTWTANQVVTFQVRTKGAYDAGSDADASYSPWSDSAVVTFKTVPVATITSPANASVYTDATLRVTVGFSQAESATFVKAQLELLQGATSLETLESVIQAGITLATPVANGGSYSIKARVQDSNGIWSAWVTNTFTVTYLSPVPAVVTLTYLPDSGWGQLDLAIAAPGGGQAAATKVTITRTIDGVEETVTKDYPVAGTAMTFLDTFPTIHGTNAYKVTTTSAIGATSVVTANLVTAELRRAFLSKGTGFATVVCFGANLVVKEGLGVANDTFAAAGRIKAIGLYGVETDVVYNVQSFIYEGFGSTLVDVRKALLMTGKAGFRDSSGRRIVGAANGSISSKKDPRGDLSFTLSETS